MTESHRNEESHGSSDIGQSYKGKIEVVFIGRPGVGVF